MGAKQMELKMRTNLAVLKFDQHSYTDKDHGQLLKNLRIANRDHYHLREGRKEKMPFIVIIKVDLPSGTLWGHLGGPDDDNVRKNELLDIKFSIEIDDKGKVDISIDSTDRTTTYEESMRLVLYSMRTMAKKSVELTKNNSGGNGADKKGFYPESATKRGFFRTFESTVTKAVSELVLPKSFRASLRRALYNLKYYKGK